MANEIMKSDERLISDVKQIVEQGLQTAYQGVNRVQISTYWQIGRRIVEEEQNGEDRAEYGTYLMKNLAKEMANEYGDAYSLRNLQLMRQFYLLFRDLEIVNARVRNLRWTHFRSLLRVLLLQKQNWSVLSFIILRISCLKWARVSLLWQNNSIYAQNRMTIS